LTPVSSQKLTDNFTTVRFELVNKNAYPGTPNFRVQMDGNDPITTSETQQAFTGLAPGAHTVTIQMVDANGTPVPGGRASIQFFVSLQTSKPAGNAPQGAASISGPSDQQDDPDLPPASSPLPLISIIGFGILVGGIVSAMKTRS
jgi:hypothetical protein